MTYCCGILVRDGLVMMADTRTNAGPDNIASFGKMAVVAPGDRVIAMMSAGNLAVTQAVVARVTEGQGLNANEPMTTLLTVNSMHEAAELVGAAIKHVFQTVAPSFNQQSFYDASIILAGQIAGDRMRMFHVYAAGNYIEATQDTPFFQIGETKYGKPILDRIIRPETSLEDAARCALVSLDSTIRSNLSVGMPIDILVYERDTLDVRREKRIYADDEYFKKLSAAWSDALRSAFAKIEEFKV